MRFPLDDDARFENCVFKGHFEEWFSHTAEFVDCTFIGKIVRSKFSGRPWPTDALKLHPPRDRNEFRGNDFSDCELVDIAFVNGIDIDAQRWPAGKQYVRLDRLRERLARARAVIEHWPESEARKTGLFSVRFYSDPEYTEQNALFTDKFAPGGPFDHDTLARFWAVMEQPLERPN